jgi:hypothetical protein
MEGVQLNMVSRERLDRMASMEKLRMIIDEVKSGRIIVLESGLSPEEEAKLIEMTMVEIDHEKFVGIEVETYRQKTGSFLGRLFGKPKGRLTVIGPANRLETLHRQSDFITAMVKFED